MAIRSLVFRQYGWIMQLATATHWTCTQSPLAIAQRRPHTQIKEISVFYWHHWLHGSRISPDALVARFPHDGCHPRTPTTHRTHGTMLIPRFMKWIPIINPQPLLQLRLYSISVWRKTSIHRFSTWRQRIYAIHTVKKSLISLRRQMIPYSSWRKTIRKRRTTTKLAVSCYRNNRTIQPNKSGIGLVPSQTLKLGVTQPSANVSRLLAVLLLRSYFNGHRLMISSEHDAHKWNFILVDSTRRLARKRHWISKFSNLKSNTMQVYNTRQQTHYCNSL